jgi:hypothetical protein
MVYRVVVSPRALKEIKEAIDYYATISEKAPIRFITEMNGINLILSLHLFFRIYYKKVRQSPWNFFHIHFSFILKKSQKQYVFCHAFIIAEILTKDRFDFLFKANN